MRFSRFGDSYRVTHITGPTHNLLGLVFADSATQNDPEVREYHLREDNGHRHQLRRQSVVAAVLEGVRDVNTELGTCLCVQTIEYVPSDSGPESSYRDLAQSIARRVALGEPFTEGKRK